MCSSCPTDPGLMGTGRCWIDGANKEQVSMLLLAKAQKLRIMGRVYAFASNCGVYEMRVED